jgi:hypothetical protein
MPYNETIIEDYPLSWLEFYTGWGFPNYSQFKPTYPKWWEDMKARCWNDECGHTYFLKDVEVYDPFVDETTCRGNEYYVRHSCPKCGKMIYTRKMLFDILKDQVVLHLNKHKQTKQ